MQPTACGICHSDALTKEGHWPGIAFPRVPGHEVIGVIDAVGPDVPGRWQAGQRVGVGWHAWPRTAGCWCSGRPGRWRCRRSCSSWAGGRSRGGTRAR
ncbi:MAG: alcohol dehydrogenase catalytic domain-containing protein [Gemmataceae bacterium]|nr:alcohol dehydrogenase catalytic domain-containing protein [Gemmataceae bacterium]